MKSKFKTTNISDTGVLVAIGTDGKKLYKAIDIARSLGYKRPDAAVKRFCKNPATIVAPTFNQFGGRCDQPVKFIEVDDVMRILYGCTLPKAIKFRIKMEADIAAERIAKEAAAKEAAEEKSAKETAAKKAAAEKAAKEAATKKAAKDDDLASAIEDFIKDMSSVLTGECGMEMPKLIVISF